MKKKILFILVLLFSVVALVACGETITGEQGPKGDPGDAGKSAYELAKENGFTGTLDEWLDQLVGERGVAGAPGKNGAKGVDGKDAHKVTIYEEDGCMYWKTLPNEGETDTYEPIYLYDTLDYITVRYFLAEGQDPVKTEQIKRAELGEAELLEYEDNDPAIGMGYTHDGWVDADGDEYESFTNHSVDLYLVKHYQGVNITVKYGLDGDGNQISTYECGAFADYLTTLFLADVSEAKGSTVTKEGFYDLFNKSYDVPAQQFMGQNGSDPCGLCAAKPELVTKWGALIQFASAKADSYRDTALQAHGLTPYGSSFKSFDPDTNDNKYINRYLIGALASFMNHNMQDVDSESHNPANFADATLYLGIDELYPTELATFLTDTANLKTEFANINNLTVINVEGAIFYLESDVTKTPVALHDLVEGETYVYGCVIPE